ncbi:hypothetical protein [Luteimonas suaedae]|uniref:hypothetical protein n=1 Tax=Luteimonas suaedae TaxID=2605430 RepID=UPI0016593747|nr:hypothetical protein [Luteimonas suaedae]
MIDARGSFGTRKTLAARSGAVIQVELGGGAAAPFVHGDASAPGAMAPGDA